MLEAISNTDVLTEEQTGMAENLLGTINNLVATGAAATAINQCENDKWLARMR